MLYFSLGTDNVICHSFKVGDGVRVGVCVFVGVGVFDGMRVDEGNGVRIATLGTKIRTPVRRNVEAPIQLANFNCLIEIP